MASMEVAEAYTGAEPSFRFSDPNTGQSALFEYRSSRIPPEAVPIVDEGAVIGYRHEAVTGVFRIYDLEGNVVGMEELPLESPLIDPLDILFIGGALARLLGRGALRAGVRGASRRAGAVGGRLAASSLYAAAATTLRAAFRRIVQAELKFTATTAAHMANPSRYVPVHILKIALRYGSRTADPQGVAGAFRYVIPMSRNGRRYMLEVVVRERDWTVLHFLYR